MNLSFLWPGTVSLVLLAVILFLPRAWFGKGARNVSAMLVFLLGIGATFVILNPGMSEEWWLVWIGAASVFTALGTAAYTAYLTGRLAQGQDDMFEFQQKQAEHEDANPQLLPNKNPFSPSKKSAGLSVIRFDVANRGRSPTALETVRLMQIKRGAGWEDWVESDSLTFWRMEEWPGKGDRTVPGGTVRGFTLTGKTFTPEEEQAWTNANVFLKIETITGHQDCIRLARPTREEPPYDERAEAMLQDLEAQQIEMFEATYGKKNKKKVERN